ncbi:hypothetical protein OAV88_03310 [bacterium]|nr:hypothetical protein [bacterium]
MTRFCSGSLKRYLFFHSKLLLLLLTTTSTATTNLKKNIIIMPSCPACHGSQGYVCTKCGKRYCSNSSCKGTRKHYTTHTHTHTHTMFTRHTHTHTGGHPKYKGNGCWAGCKASAVKNG